MRTLGRLILFAVGVALIVLAIPNIINAVNALNATSWTDPNMYPEKWNNIVIIIGQSVNVLCGLIAVFASITNKIGFFCFVVAVIMGATGVWSLITAIQANALTDWQAILRAVGSVALPILYFIGTLLAMFRKNSE